MMMPSIFGENLFDDFDSWFSDPVEKRFFGKKNPLYGKHAKNLMKTDVRETKDSYEVDVDLPGFKKDEIKMELENGYLTISAAKGLDKDETDKKTGKYIRRERYAGNLSRSFYVGENVKQEDFKASFKNGKHNSVNCFVSNFLIYWLLIHFNLFISKIAPDLEIRLTSNASINSSNEKISCSPSGDHPSKAI